MNIDNKSTTVSAEEEALNELTAQLSSFNWKDGVVDKARRMLYSPDIQDNIKGVISLKSMLCIGREEVYEVAQEVIDSGVIARLVEFLYIDNHNLQCPAAFCLTNIAAGHDVQTQIVVEAGAIQPLIGFLRHSDPQLRRQAIFCLANVAGSTEEYRIMLSRDPLYFSSMFGAADMVGDNKILDLVCWNLRNVCVLGGPTFQDIKAGVEFLIDKILKYYYQFPIWSQSLKFALETVCSVCRIPEGRESMIQCQIILNLMNILEHSASSGASSILASTYEALAWVIAYGSDFEKTVLIEARMAMTILTNSAIKRKFGLLVQELSLKCLACIADSENNEKFLTVLESYPSIFDTTAEIFLGTSPDSANIYLGCPDKNSQLPNSSAIREYAAFIFTNCLLARSLPHIMDAHPQNVLKVLLEIIEFCSEQIRIKSTEAPVSECGPSLPAIAETLTVRALKALTQFISRGEVVQQEQRLPDNLVLGICFEQDAPNRLRNVLNNTVLPPEAYEVGNIILNHFLAARPCESTLFSYA